MIGLAGRGEGTIWTEEHRARHETRLKERVSGYSTRATPARAVVAALYWHLRVGGPWRALPGGFPPRRTVYGWFRRWLERGLFDALLRGAAWRRRRAAGRRRGPRLGIIDTQSVKCIAVRGPRGWDAHKKVHGRKRVALVDAEGFWLAVAVVPANVQDWDTLPALDAGKAHWPSLREAIVDRIFRPLVCHEWSNFHGMRHHVVARDPTAKGFRLLPRRWVVERSFGWLAHWGGLLRDRVGRLDVATARLAFVGALSGLDALLNPCPSRRLHSEPTQTGCQEALSRLSLRTVARIVRRGLI